MRSIAFTVAALQLTIAVFAVYSSSQDVLSDGACIGGIFGTLANLLMLSVSVVVALILGVRSRRHEKARHALGSWLILAASSSVAILIGQYAAPSLHRVAFRLASPRLGPYSAATAASFGFRAQTLAFSAPATVTQIR
jgi:predicted Co/Zn/Cd cation transporter (cation efflux family)